MTAPQSRAPEAAASEIARRSWVCHSGSHRGRQDRDEEVVGEVLAGLLSTDPQWVEQTAVAVLDGELDRLDSALHPR